MLKRHAHYLKSNDSSETIYECVFYDTETRTELDAAGSKRHILVFGWGAYIRRLPGGSWSQPVWLRFTDGETFWKWLTGLSRPKRTLYVFAHNHAFDYCVTDGPSELPKLGWRMSDAIVDGPPFIVTYRQLTRKIVLTDTLNIWRTSLLKMGERIGLTKLEMPEKWTGSASDDNYCRRDVEVMVKAVTEWSDFLLSKDMGKFQLTVASQAMTTFRHRYLTHSILIDDDKTALDIARKAYHGGRVECGYIGRRSGHFFMLDINSLYPFVMSINRFPVRLVGTYEGETIESLRYFVRNYCAVAQLTVETSAPCVPVVHEHKLIFPTGLFDTYVSTPEIEYLLQCNAVKRVKSVAVYEYDFPFQEFVHDLYGNRVQARLRGDLVESEHYKLLLNSFSGKWGQNGKKWETVGSTPDLTIAFWPSVDFWSDRITHFRRFNGCIQKRFDLPESANSHPAIAAHITAYGRMVLWTLIRKLPPEDYFYCDTDAVLCSAHGKDLLMDLIDDVVLGKLKIVGEFRNIEIYGPKDYCLDGKPVIKGIRKDAKPLDAGVYEQTRWSNFKGLLRKGDISRPLVTVGTKRLTRIYTKGLVTPSGFVTPHHLVDGKLTTETGFPSVESSLSVET